ncbi:uncharacterized protein PAC_17176 [Phialocephala subalpina]|uniref:Clr5 domain-containing protein n=1 Tax=Phialocephala subalpina TaxID=576137 RepID=A0A1L7XQR9_9HELO|nr:uncharacterized protein PAC_17176 [Phialocephala subalpina]
MSQPTVVRVPNPSPEQVAADAKLEKISTKARNDLQWEAHKGEIERIYVRQDKTLPETMQEIEQRFGFKKRFVYNALALLYPRSWKSKMKDWGFDKNMTSDIQFMVSKATKRQRDEGKNTVFMRDGVLVPQETLDKFKRRKPCSSTMAKLPSIKTPPNITYATQNAKPELEYSHSRSRSILPLDSIIYRDVLVKEMTLTRHDESELSKGEIPGLLSLTNPQSNPDIGSTSLSGSLDEPLKIPTYNQDHSDERSTSDNTFSAEYDGAVSAMERLFLSFNSSNARLEDFAYDECMHHIAWLLESATSNEDRVHALFRQNFIASTNERIDRCAAVPLNLSEKLAIILRGLIRDRNYYTYRLPVAQNVCYGFIESFPQTSRNIDRWAARFSFGKLLFEMDLPNEAVRQLIESFYESLVLWKEDPGRVDLLGVLRELQDYGNRVENRWTKTSPEISTALDSIRCLCEDEFNFLTDAKLLAYLMIKFAQHSFVRGWLRTARNLMASVDLGVLKVEDDYRKKDCIEVLLKVSRYYFQDNDFVKATSMISTAYKITQPLLPSKDQDAASSLLPETPHPPWQQAWMEVLITQQLANKYPETARQIDDIHSRLGNPERIRLTAQVVPAPIPSLDWSTLLKPRDEYSSKASVSDFGDQSSTKLGITYGRSMISGETGLSGFSMDITALFPSEPR